MKIYFSFHPFLLHIFLCIQTEEGSGAGIWGKSIFSLSKDLRDGVQEGDRDGGEEDVGDHVDDRGGHGKGRQDVRRVRWLRRVVLRPRCCPLGLLEYFIVQLDYHFSTYSIDKYFNVLHLESKSFHWVVHFGIFSLPCNRHRSFPRNQQNCLGSSRYLWTYHSRS